MHLILAMKVFEAKEKLIKAIQTVEELKRNPQGHDELKKDVTSILEEFTRDTILELKETLRKRKKKRLRQVMQRVEAKKEKIEREAERERTSKEADAWLKQCMEVEETAKAEESVRREADAVLHDVRRKQGEANKILSLLPAISKLRAARVQQFAAQGGQPSKQITEAFETTLENLSSKWKKQLQMCNTEESILKVMLAEGSASKLGRLERETDSNLHDWLLAMFGEGTIPEITWEDLVESRKSWDRFIVNEDVPMSSALPAGWLLPEPLNGDDWKNAVNWF